MDGIDIVALVGLVLIGLAVVLRKRIRAGFEFMGLKLNLRTDDSAIKGKKIRAENVTVKDKTGQGIELKDIDAFGDVDMTVEDERKKEGPFDPKV